MGLFDNVFKSDINRKVDKFRKTSGAVLVDVRGEEDYKKGHIPGSINIPENEIEKIESQITDRKTPIFVYCLSGAKSWNAVNKLKTMGYTKARNIGGINKYNGIKEESD